MLQASNCDKNKMVYVIVGSLFVLCLIDTCVFNGYTQQGQTSDPQDSLLRFQPVTRTIESITKQDWNFST